MSAEFEHERPNGLPLPVGGFLALSDNGDQEAKGSQRPFTTFPRGTEEGTRLHFLYG